MLFMQKQKQKKILMQPVGIEEGRDAVNVLKK